MSNYPLSADTAMDMDTLQSIARRKQRNSTEKLNGEAWTLVQKNSNTKKGKGKGHMPVPHSNDSNEKGKDAAQKEIANDQDRNAKQTEESGEQAETSPSFKVGGKEIQIGNKQGSPSNPSYAEITKKKPEESSGSSEDESFERPSKKAGRKSRKEKREEEAERFKTQGSQPTIEMSIGRNTRPRPSKGGPNPPPPSSK
jgi:hypothetical protein